MSIAEFEKKRKKIIDQKKVSLDQLEKEISNSQIEVGKGNDQSNDDIKRAYTSALAAVERLQSADENNLDDLLKNADLALRTAFERLEGIGQKDAS